VKLENKILQDSDLLLVLKKKRGVLRQLLELSQQQRPIKNWVELGPIFARKDIHFEELQKADTIIATWAQRYLRPLDQEEGAIIQECQGLMESLLKSESLLEVILTEEKKELTQELGQLNAPAHYLGNTQAAKKVMNVRRKPVL